MTGPDSPDAAVRSTPDGPTDLPADLPVDVAAWIDAHDPELLEPAVSADAGRVLDEQRVEHEPDSRDANDEVGALVNNTGDDGGAASG